MSQKGKTHKRKHKIASKNHFYSERKNTDPIEKRKKRRKENLLIKNFIKALQVIFPDIR